VPRTTATGTSARPGRFWLAAAGSTLMVVLADVLFVLNPFGQELENLALLGARDEFRELRADSLEDLSSISAIGFAVSIAVVMLLALLRRKPALALAAAAVMAGSAVTTELAKRVLFRPELIDAPPNWLSNSFPSGHVTVAVAVGIGAVLVVPYALRPLTTLVAVVYATGIAQAVGIAGWHRLSDVIGAAFVVLAIASLVLAALALNGRVRSFQRPRRIGFLLVALLLGGTGLILVGAGALFGLARLLPVPADPSPDDLELAYATTLVIGSGVIALAFLAFHALIRPFAIDEPDVVEAPTGPTTAAST
jgi:membrane-associated phospholipid phosphatase